MNLSHQEQIKARLALGHYLRAHREHKDFSQAEVAERIGCGMHRQMVSKIERGKVEVLATHIAFMVELLDLCPEEVWKLLRGESVTLDLKRTKPPKRRRRSRRPRKSAQ